MKEKVQNHTKLKPWSWKRSWKLSFFHTSIEKCKREILIWKGPNEHQGHIIRRCQQAIKVQRGNINLKRTKWTSRAHNKEVPTSNKSTQQRSNKRHQRSREVFKLNKGVLTNKETSTSNKITQEECIDEHQQNTTRRSWWTTKACRTTKKYQQATKTHYYDMPMINKNTQQESNDKHQD